MKIAFSPPDISNLEIQEVVDTLRSGWITTGPKTKLFEQKIGEYTHTPRVVCLNSATAALELTLRVLGVGSGDEVITSAYTYTASASVIQHVGAGIILVDTAKSSFEMDYDQLEAAISDKTKVIIPVDLAGIMCDYDRIFEIVERKKNLFTPSNQLQQKFERIVVLADAAHSFGATYKGQASGQAADFTCFSFHAVKNLTTSEGGAVTWREIPGLSSDELYKQFMLLSLHGQTKDALHKTKQGAWEYDILCTGYKCNMTDIMASLGLGQIKRYPEILAKRRSIIEMYDKLLAESSVTPLRHYGRDFSSSGHLYMVSMRGKDELERNTIIQHLAEKGIATNVHYKPLPILSIYRKMGFVPDEYPNAYEQYKSEITLPLHTLLTEEQVRYVATQFKHKLGG